MHSVVLTELGTVVLEGGKVVKSFAFEQPAADFVKAKSGQYNHDALISFLMGINSGFLLNDDAFLKTLKKESLDVHHMNEKQMEEIQTTKPQLLVDAGFAKNESDAMARLRDFALQLSSARVTEISQSPDLHIGQSIKALDEIDVMINGLSSRLREWYGLHFPELDNIIDSINGYAQIVMAGKRLDLSTKVYEDAGFPESKVQMLSVIQEKSKGGEISKENLVIVQSIASQILEMAKMRKKIEDHVETEMNTIAPNVAAILGTAVGARILARAGSLKKMATLPASTIQVLGAEKALFRSLKTGTQPPKHGILFQHPLVHASPKWQRGKMARAIASKAAIASRVDVYGSGLNHTLLEKLNVRVAEIGEKYKEPTERPPQPQRMERRQDDFRRRDNFRSREGFRPRDSFRPRENRSGGDMPREGFRQREGFRSREDRPQGEFRQREGFRPREDRPRDGFKPRGDSRPRDSFRPKGESRSDGPRREFRGDGNKRKKFGKRRY
ncbi:MAG: NOP5/NOP56 family protein [Candidatus Nitrosotenuis sp.]